MANEAKFRGTRQDLAKILVSIPRDVAGGVDAAQGVQLRVGMEALSLIKEAFVIRARGGTDDSGLSWEPLKRATVAGRRPPPHKKRGERPRGLLTMAQDDLWRKIYGGTLARLKGKGYAVADAHGLAAGHAWTVVKVAGGKTRLDTLGGRSVEILRDTGLLLNSLSPGIDGPSGHQNQVFRLEAGAVIVGTNRVGAAAHHYGVPGRLPQRRLWPEPAKWPASWWKRILDTAKAGIREVITQKLREKAR